jgi:hypothetical protein
MDMENFGGMIPMGKFLIHPPELSGSPTSSHLVAEQEKLAKEIINVLYKIFFHIL